MRENRLVKSFSFHLTEGEAFQQSGRTVTGGSELLVSGGTQAEVGRLLVTPKLSVL